MTRELFLKDRALADRWRKITHGEDFERVLTYARAHIAEGGSSLEELRGVERLAHALLNMAEAEEKPFAFPTSGLHHQPEIMPERPTEAATTKSKTPRKK